MNTDQHDTLVCPSCGYERPPRETILEPGLCPECGVFDVPVGVRPLRHADRRRMWIWSVLPTILICPMFLLTKAILPGSWGFGYGLLTLTLVAVVAIVMPIAMLDIYRERRRFSGDAGSLLRLILSAWGVNICLAAVTLVLLSLI